MKLEILIVDDDKKLLSALKTILIEEEDEVTLCSDGRKAIDICRSRKFDLVITDLMMPGASGLEVLRETRRVYPETFVILITGFASLETAVQAIREGAYDYITKPFKLDEFKIIFNNVREKIRLIRENRELINELQDAYEQLRLMKKIMGLDEKSEPVGTDSVPESKNTTPFIAGSMLPLFYSENKNDIYPPILSDLERISTLRERGFLTEEEYNLCKSKLFRNLKH